MEYNTIIQNLCNLINTNHFKNDIIVYAPLAKYTEEYLELKNMMKKYLSHELQIYSTTPTPGNKLIQLSHSLQDIPWVLITSHLDFICKSERPIVYVYLENYKNTDV